MQCFNSVAVGDIVVFKAHQKFGFGLIFKLAVYNEVIFADTLWHNGIIIRCNVEMLQVYRGGCFEDRKHN